MSEFLATDNREEKKERTLKMELDRKSPPSVFFVNYRSIYPDNYPAKFDEELAKLLIQHYSNEGETVLDPMSGSGTIPLEATKLNRNAIACDVNTAATDLIAKKYGVVKNAYKIHGELTIKNGDSRAVPLEDNAVDFILTSPPFGLSIDAKHDKYSDNKKDIANVKTYGQWRDGHKKILSECLRVLKPNRLAGFEIRPRSKDGHSFPLFSWIVQDAEEVGFQFYCDYIEVVTPYMMWTMGQDGARKPFPTHSYILMFKKPENSQLA